MKKLISQIFKFGVTGVICFLIQTGILTALTELFGVPYMISSFIGFTVSVIVNYIMSITIVFEPDRQCGKVKQFSVFLILSIIGLGIYQILMWLITPWLEKYMSRAYTVSYTHLDVYKRQQPVHRLSACLHWLLTAITSPDYG